MAVLIIVALLAYVAAPVALVIGWVKWFRTPAERGFMSRSSFVGFVMGTISALLALCSALYAFVAGGFRYYDPKLLLIIELESCSHSLAWLLLWWV